MSARGTHPNITLSYHLLSPHFTSLTIFHRAYFIQDITSIEKVHDYKFHGLRISDQSQRTYKLSKPFNQVHGEINSINQ